MMDLEGILARQKLRAADHPEGKACPECAVIDALVAEVERLSALITDHDGPGLAWECYRLGDEIPEVPIG